MCYYSKVIIKLEHFDSNNFLVDKKSHENILIYDISYKTLIGSKPLHFRFDKIDGNIRTYDGTRYLAFFVSKKYDAVYNRIRYCTSLKSSITYIFLTFTQKLKLILIVFHL